MGGKGEPATRSGGDKDRCKNGEREIMKGFIMNINTTIDNGTLAGKTNHLSNVVVLKNSLIELD